MPNSGERDSNGRFIKGEPGNAESESSTDSTDYAAFNKILAAGIGLSTEKLVELQQKYDSKVLYGVLDKEAAERKVEGGNPPAVRQPLPPNEPVVSINPEPRLPEEVIPGATFLKKPDFDPLNLSVHFKMKARDLFKKDGKKGGSLLMLKDILKG